MPKVAHLITNLGVGGAEMMLYKLLAHSGRGGPSMSVISMTDEGALGERIRALGIPLQTLNVRKGPSAAAAIARLVHLLRRPRPDVLQTWLYDADLLGLLAGRVAGVPKIAWNVRCSDLPPAYTTGPRRLIVSALARLSPLPDVVIANAAAGADAHRRLGYRPRRWQILPNGFDLDTFRPDSQARQWLRALLGAPQEAPLIGLVARFDPLKDQQNFLNAAGLLHSRRPHVHFVMIGRGIERENPALRRMIDEAGISFDRLHLLGERQDIAMINAALDISTSASKTEGFPNALGEAMASGSACVATDVGDCAAMLGDTGMLVPPGDPAALADAWSSLLDMTRGERQRLGASARQRIEAHYKLPEICARYRALYEELASEQRRGSAAADAAAAGEKP